MTWVEIGLVIGGALFGFGIASILAAGKELKHEMNATELKSMDRCQFCDHPITAHLTFSGAWDDCEICGCTRAQEWAAFVAQLWAS